MLGKARAAYLIHEILGPLVLSLALAHQRSGAGREGGEVEICPVRMQRGGARAEPSGDADAEAVGEQVEGLEVSGAGDGVFD